MTRLTMRSTRALLGAATLALAPSHAVAQGTDVRPTVAVLYFSNASLVDHATYDALVLGIADQLITSLGENPSIRVVERRQIQALIDEQKLSRDGQVDRETAVQVGKMLGAHHMILGGFLIEPSGRLRIAARAVNVNTSEVEHTETVTGDMRNIIDAIDALASRLDSGLRLPEMPRRGRRASGASTPRSDRWFMYYSQAMVEEDANRKDNAMALYRRALDENPDYQKARDALERLQRGM